MTRVLKGKYSPASSSFLEAATVKPNISYTWRSILAAKDLLKKGLGLQRNTRRVWADPWVPNFRVMQSRNHPPADQSIFHASDLIIISNGEWNLAKLRTHFTDWQVSTSEADSWSSGLSNNGFYSVKTLMSAYYLALQGVNSVAVGEQNSKVNNAAAPNIRRSKFLQVYQVLKSQLLNDPAFEWTSASRQWVQEMLEYNVPRGKLNRGLSVIDSYRLLKDGKELTDDEFFLASALGWCIEWLQAYFLVLDDIMDSSHTRRGQPCWFRVPKVGMIAVNDGIILRNHIPRILKNHFRNKKYYVDLLDLFDEVEFQSASGHMIDLITTIEGEKDLSNYSLDLHRRIVQYKTAYNSFYLSVACALLISGEKLEDHVDVKNILIDMGIYFQVQDDYLDCYGDPEFIGKIGTDIENFKCSWLVVKALELCNDEQKKVLYENYGKDDPACVARVKELYNVLNMQGAFADYESKSYDKLIDSIEAHPSTAVQAVLKSFLAKIYKRQK